MKKQLTATVVAGIILFAWQFVSWAALNIHGSETQYTENQGAILEALSANLSADGTYFMPQLAPGSPKEEQKVFMNEMTGKPWATVSYHKAMNAGMSMNMIRGLVVDLVTAFLLVWLLGKIGSLDFKTAVLGSIAVGAMSYLTIPYLNSIWYGGSTVGYLIDAIAQWGLAGVWLGWWMTRK
ncbi:MAG: hypothetical protein EPO28_15045 [Saprospiraceae bacterium]|nr:MAG: hypothetical protein EPO28_15045 [Saprospiraceae bacterium]